MVVGWVAGARGSHSGDTATPTPLPLPQVWVLPQASAASAQPWRPATLVSVPLKSLALHRRLAEGVDAVESRLSDEWAAHTLLGAPNAANGNNYGSNKALRPGTSVSDNDEEGRAVGDDAHDALPRDGVRSLGTASTKTMTTTTAMTMALKRASTDVQPHNKQLSWASTSHQSAGPHQGNGGPRFHWPLTRAQSHASRRPWCLLTITGAFSHAQAFEWLNACLPELPREEDTVIMTTISSSTGAAGLSNGGGTSAAYAHCGTGAHTLVAYRRGSISVRSELPSTVAILHEVSRTCLPAG